MRHDQPAGQRGGEAHGPGNYVAAAGGVVVGTVAGVGLYDGWWGSSAAATSLGATATTSAVAGGVIGVGAVSGLFLRDGSLPEVNVRSAIAQLRGLANSIRTNRERLTAPARIWTENAQYQAYYARTMLEKEVQSLDIPNTALRAEFLAACTDAIPVIREHE